MPAHVFNVPKPYRGAEPHPQEKPRTKFRWFGQSLRLSKTARSTSSAKSTASTSVKNNEPLSSPTASPSSSRSAFCTSPTSASSSSTAPTALLATKSLTDSFAIRKRHFSLLHSAKSSPTGSVRASIASTASSTSSASTTNEELRSSSTHNHTHNDCESDNQLIHSPRIEYETRKLLRQVMGMDAEWSSDDHVERHFADQHWRIERIQADGNCLFRAISDQIYRNEAFYTDIRRRVVEYIAREKDLFQPFVENEQTNTHEPIGAYCTRMKTDAQWGGNPELFAAARLFNVHIVVHQGPLRRLRIENGSQTPPNMELHLLYRNDHYDSLHDETQLDDKPRLSTTVAISLEEDVSVEEPVKEEPEAVVVVSEEGTTVGELLEKTKEKKEKRKKCVVFLGEETRVERMHVDDMPVPVVVRRPVRAIVRCGKVCSAVEVSNQQQEDEEEEEEEEEEPAQDHSPLDNQTEPVDQELQLPVARVQRVNFRRGRRVE